MLRRATALLLAASTMSVPASAQTIYPVDQAEILAGSRFDLKIELPGTPAAEVVQVTINGRPAAEVVGGKPAFIVNEDGLGHSAYWIRGAAMGIPGDYKVEARAGDAKAEVRWQVFDTPTPTAKNVILFVGDGLTNAHRVAARMLSKGIKQGRYGGSLALEDMPHMALVSTAGTDSIITDSANSMSAFTTGHKSCVNAMGVYCARNKGTLDHPKVETIAEIARRVKGMAIGVVTNTGIEDATPAAVVAHVRRRADHDRIVEMFFALKPEVMLGGGSANFLPKPNGKRSDNVDYLKKFEEAGYKLVSTGAELGKVAADPATRHLLGLFNTGNMDGALDRRILKKGTVSRFPDQPDLTDEVKAALAVLERSDKGFVLVVESGMIDKYAHALDWERSVYDVIMLDNAVAMAKAWAEKRGDTLIVVVADHTHPAAIIGTYDDARQGDTPRDKLAIYADAGFPNYPKADNDGYPASVDVSRRIAFTFSAFPDHCDAGKPYLAAPNRPTQPHPSTKADERPKAFVANEAGCQIPGVARRTGNLPFAANSGVHSGEDVLVTATGPGADAFRGRIDNTAVFRAIASALGLGATK